MNTTDKLQTAGIAIALTASIWSAGYAYVVDRQMQCLQESVPKYISTMQVLEQKKSELTFAKQAFSNKIAQVSVDAKTQQSLGRTDVDIDAVKTILNTLLSGVILLGDFPNDIRPYMSDAEFDELSKLAKINTKISAQDFTPDQKGNDAAKRLNIALKRLNAGYEQSIEYMNSLIETRRSEELQASCKHKAFPFFS